MSINYVEDDPLGDDAAVLKDGADLNVPEPSHGTDTLDNDTPDSVDAFTHLRRDSRGRDLSLMDMFLPDRDEGLRMRDRRDPDAAFGTGTREHPTRDVRGEALQTRAVIASAFNSDQLALTSSNSVTVVVARPERLRVRIANVGVNTAYLGARAGSATPATGYPLAAGAWIELEVTAEVRASCIDGSPTTLAVLDMFFTDSLGQ